MSAVIENKYAQPSKNMVIKAGVELCETGRVVNGPPLKIEN